MSENKVSDNEQPGRRKNGWWSLAVVLAVILFTSAIRIRLLDVPLERDEGHYAYAAQLMLEAVPPYTGVYIHFLPGIYVIYALIMTVFGQTHVAIHLGLLIVNCATILLMFSLGKRLFGPLVGAGAAVAFALLSLGQRVQGVFANTEHFVIFFALAGIVLMLGAVDSRRYLFLLAGAVLLGASFVIKQPSASFIVFMGLYLLFCELRRRPFSLKLFVTSGAVYLIGILLPFVVICVALWWAGVFDRFVFWTFHYAREYVSSVPFLVGIKNLRMQFIWIAVSALLLWLLACVGLICLFIDRRMRRHWPFVLGFLVFSFLATCPGLYFREHYFILLLPAVALLAGIGTAGVQRFFAERQSIMAPVATPVILALVVLLYTVYQQKQYLFFMSPEQVSRTTYGLNPFPESLKIADFIEKNTDKDDRIAVIGSEPQIYFYSHRRSATGYAFTYLLMEPHPYALRMQQQMIEEVETAGPKIMVFVNVYTSWLTRPSSQKLVFDWFQKYQMENYKLVGVVDMVSADQIIYRWGEDVVGYKPQSSFWLTVYRRIN